MLPTQSSSVMNQPGQVYTDLNGLQAIRSLGKSDEKAAIMQVAKQFESMFIGMMLSSMRDANQVFEEDSLLHSPESDFYQTMLDQQLSVSLAGQRGIGLADVIYKQMLGQYGKNKRNTDENDEGSSEPAAPSAPLRRIHSHVIESAMAEVQKELDTMPVEVSAIAADISPDVSHPAAQGSGNKGQQFTSAGEFVAALYPAAVRIADELDVDVKAIIAQAALETGWGKYVITDDQGISSYNLFGIKADERWQGSSVEVITHEYRDGVRVNEKARFRSYASLQEGLQDYADFLQSAARYEPAIGKGLGSSHYGYALQQAGYATDPDYGRKISRISESDTLQSALQDVSGQLTE